MRRLSLETTVINSVVSLFLIMLVGVYGSKKNIITADVNKGLIDILMNISLPALIFSSYMITFDENLKLNVYKSFGLSALTFLLIILISNILVIPIKGEKRNVVNFANIFTNTGFMGFPLLSVIYGPEGVLYGSSFSMFFNLLVFSYGIVLVKGLQKDEDRLKAIVDLIKNPTILAVIFGMFIILFSIRVPEVLVSSLKLVGNLTGPVSMIVIGVFLSNMEFKDTLKDWSIYYGVICRLLIIPAILIFFYKQIGQISLPIKSILVQAAMPTATLASIFAKEYNKMLDYTTLLVLLTTIFSIITIPIIVQILG